MPLESLAHFPSSVLALILSESYSYLALRLWKCGDSLLNTKLARDGAPYLHLKQDGYLPLNVPRLVTSLRSLRSFSLSQKYAKFYDDHMDWVRLRESLPATLETIFIESLDAHHFLYNFRSSTDPDDIESSDLYGRGCSRFVDLTKHFPRLSDLTVWQNRGDYNKTDLAGLPPTLTRFTLGSCTLNQDDYIIWKYLPRNLTELDSRITFGAVPSPLPSDLIYDWQHCIPPSLTNFGTFLAKGGDFRGYVLLLPKAMVKGSIFLPSPASAFPPNIEYLGLSSAQLAVFTDPEPPTPSNHWPILLPARLTTFIIKQHGGGTEIAVLGSNVRFLPATLTHLNSRLDFTEIAEYLRSTDPGLTEHDKVMKLWPPKLSLLNLLSPSIPTDGKALHYLPRVLKHLGIFDSLIVNDEAMDVAQIHLDHSGLPHTLVNLEVHSEVKWSVVLTRHLNLPLLRKFKFSGFPEPDSAPQSISDLPASLDTLIINTSLDPDRLTERSWSFPSNLTRLELSEWNNVWTQFLPRGLLSLTIGWLYGFEGLTNGDGEFDTLPTSLTRLKVGKSTFTDQLSRSALPLLPPQSFGHLTHLVHLDMRFVHLPSSALKYLSRRLETIDIKLQSILPEHIQDLPPRLKDADFGTASFEWGVLTNWPVEELNDEHKQRLIQLRREVLYH